VELTADGAGLGPYETALGQRGCSPVTTGRRSRCRNKGVPFAAVPLRARQGAPVHMPNALAMLRSMGLTMGAPIPACGVSADDLKRCCIPMLNRCPSYCSLCGANPLNREADRLAVASDKLAHPEAYAEAYD
jgi:hypothetical protein